MAELCSEKSVPSPDGSKLADSVIAEYYKQTITETIPLTGFNEKIKRRQESFRDYREDGYRETAD